VNVTPEKSDPAERLIQNLAEGRRAAEADQPPVRLTPDERAAAERDTSEAAVKAASQRSRDQVAAEAAETDDEQAAETEGEAGDQPATEAEPSVRELPPKPGELVRTKKGALEYAERWAIYYRALPREDEEAFIDETDENCRIAKALNPKAEDIFSDALNAPKTLV
jgi:hypothetical protein